MGERQTTGSRVGSGGKSPLNLSPLRGIGLIYKQLHTESAGSSDKMALEGCLLH